MTQEEYYNYIKKYNTIIYNKRRKKTESTARLRFLKAMILMQIGEMSDYAFFDNATLEKLKILEKKVEEEQVLKEADYENTFIVKKMVPTMLTYGAVFVTVVSLLSYIMPLLDKSLNYFLNFG